MKRVAARRTYKCMYHRTFIWRNQRRIRACFSRPFLFSRNNERCLSPSLPPFLSFASYVCARVCSWGGGQASRARVCTYVVAWCLLCQYEGSGGRTEGRTREEAKSHGDVRCEVARAPRYGTRRRGRTFRRDRLEGKNPSVRVFRARGRALRDIIATVVRWLVSRPLTCQSFAGRGMTQ